MSLDINPCSGPNTGILPRVASAEAAITLVVVRYLFPGSTLKQDLKDVVSRTRYSTTSYEPMKGKLNQQEEQIRGLGFLAQYNQGNDILF